MASTLSTLAAVARALATLVSELLLGNSRLEPSRLSVRPRAVSHAQAHSTRCGELRAFVDGSVLADGRMGLAVFYARGHPSNFHGGFDAAPAAPDANLAELAAVFWALAHHPRGQQLLVFSDSAHALRSVQMLLTDSGGASWAGADARWRPLVRAIHWLLRLRSAPTSFFKVAAHRGAKPNETADALAQAAAAASARPRCAVPVGASRLATLWLLLRFLLRQHRCDGGVGGDEPPRGDAAAAPAAAARAGRRPQPLDDSVEPTELVALDCEMVGVGIGGLESRLASVAVVNASGNLLYFSYARPQERVTDYRTRWSGITAELLKDAPSVKAVQAEVRELLKGRTVVGHGLEHDFHVLGNHLPRDRVRDTAHDLPLLCRPSGKPRRLRHLAWEFLGLTIQGGSHDPAEDARASLLLYLRYREKFEQAAARRQQRRDEREEKRAAKVAAVAAVDDDGSDDDDAEPAEPAETGLKKRTISMGTLFSELM